MAEKKVSFEDSLKHLQDIVSKLESGNVPLDKALKQFKTGVALSSQLQNHLTNAKRTLAKVVNSKGQEVPYNRDKNGQDVNETVSGDSNSAEPQSNSNDNSTDGSNSDDNNGNENSSSIINPFN